MAIYICNENGDWWKSDGKDTLYVFDTKSVDKETWEAILEDHELEGDSWVDAIKDFGTKVTPVFKIAGDLRK